MAISKRTLSILISLAMVILFAAIYLALNLNLFGVSAAAGQPAITSADSFVCDYGVGGTFQFKASIEGPASGTSLPATATNLTWSLVGAPPGVQLAGANLDMLSVPAILAAKAYSFDVVVTSGLGLSATQAFSLTVKAPPSPPVSWPAYSGGSFGGSSMAAVSYVHTVRFYSKGGTAVNSQYVVAGGKVKEPENPTKKDFEFGGWYLDPAFAAEYDFDLAVASDLNLYAKWTDGTEEKEVPPEKPQNPFTDVAGSDWFADAVDYVNGKGLMIGMGDGLFSPGINVSRAMVATILYRFSGEPDASDLPNPFADIEEGKWYTDAVKWAASEGIALGYDNGNFGPDDPVTKEQIAALVYRAQQASGKIPNDILMDREWPDWDEISDWAKGPVNVLTIQGLFRDIPGTNFIPQAPATRAEVASILYRYLTSVE